MLHPDLPFMRINIISDSGYVVGSFDFIVPINIGKVRFFYEKNNGTRQELIDAADAEFLKGEVVKYSQKLIDALKPEQGEHGN